MKKKNGMTSGTQLALVLGVIGVGLVGYTIVLMSNPAGTLPVKPVYGRSGETWWIVTSFQSGESWDTSKSQLDPYTIGDVLTQKYGDATEGGSGNLVWTVRLRRDVTFLPGKNVTSVRKIS